MSAGTIGGAIPPRTAAPDPGKPSGSSRRWRWRIGLAAVALLDAGLIAAGALSAAIISAEGYSPSAIRGLVCPQG